MNDMDALRQETEQLKNAIRVIIIYRFKKKQDQYKISTVSGIDC